MPDWTKSMQQTFEYYIVNPSTWGDKKPIKTITSCKIDRGSDQETLGHASFELTEDIGECYIRVYLITIQNGVREKFPLATVLAQTPGESFDGHNKKMSIDGYYPLLELKDDSPPIGYTISEGENIMDIAGRLIQEHMRGPVVVTKAEDKVLNDYVANTDDSWLSYMSDLISCAKFNFDVDEMGRTLFAPVKDISSLQPVTTFDDNNSSILCPEISIDRDLYGIPNVVEVVYSSNSTTYYSRVENTDENSPVSIQSRGRQIIYRDTSPSLTGVPTKEIIDDYAKQLLKSLSTLKYQLTFKHGYYPVRVGDCVRLNYRRAGLSDVKAYITNQSITCEPGCPIEETAVYTKELWGGR